jgi:hypothetical protein
MHPRITIHRDSPMLSEERFSSCVQTLSRLGVVERVEGGDGERFRMKLEAEGVLGRVFGGEFGDPPDGPSLVPWSSCVILKIVLDDRRVAVSKEEFTAMAAVLAGFMAEAEVSLRLQSRHGRPVLSQRRTDAGTRRRGSGPT